MLEERNKLVIRILHLAYLVHVETSYCVFISFSGHIDSLDISIRASRENWQQRVLETEFYTAFKKYMNEDHPSLPYLRSKIDVLEKILTFHEVPFDELSYEEICTKEYTF